MNICSNNVILDYRAENKVFEALINYGFNPIPTVEISRLYNSVMGHADLQVVKVSDTLIVSPECFDYYKNKVRINVVSGKNTIGAAYPEDILYNAAVTNSIAIHNFNFTDSVLRKYLSGRKLIGVRQGYSKCNVCIIGENAVITEDEGIYKSCVKSEIDALKISKGSVKLTDFDYGFLGGASGLFENTLYLNGQISSHCDCNKIVDFCCKYNVTVRELFDSRLSDIGSIIFI